MHEIFCEFFLRKFLPEIFWKMFIRIFLEFFPDFFRNFENKNKICEANAQNALWILRRMLMNSSRVSTLMSLDIAQLTYRFAYQFKILAQRGGDESPERLLAERGERLASPYLGEWLFTAMGLGVLAGLCGSEVVA